MDSLPLVILSDEQERTHRRVNFRKPSVLKLREFFNGDLFDHLWVCDYYTKIYTYNIILHII